VTPDAAESPADEYAGYVYDLDNTLIELAVDWDAVARAAGAVLRERGVEPPSDLWAMLETDDPEHRATVADVIERHEHAGARDSRRLPAADLLPHDAPVGVCSLNCEAACRLALDVHDLSGHVTAVVGRDTVGAWKPDPEPLISTCSALGVDPEAAVFVGDSERDETAARAAGIPFVYTDDWLRAYR